MTPRRAILLRDLLVGTSVIVSPNYFLADDVGPWVVPPAAVAALAFAWAMYRSEHDAHPDWVGRVLDRPDLIVAVSVGSLVVVLVPLVLWPWLTKWYLACFVGAGVGTIGYRFVYGILRPIPDPAIERVREGRA